MQHLATAPSTQRGQATFDREPVHVGRLGRPFLRGDFGLRFPSRGGDVRPQTSTERSLEASKLRNRAAIGTEFQFVEPVAEFLTTRINAHNVLKIRRTVLHIF